MMKVYKRGSEPKGCLYVGRGSDWGNPFRIGYDGTRTEVINKFRTYALQRLVREKDWLVPLVDRDLVCHCAPKACHADVIIELIRDLRIAQS
jgi:hypothetical protein